MGTGCSRALPAAGLESEPFRRQERDVEIDFRGFTPSRVFVCSGQSVRWRGTEGVYSLNQVTTDGKRAITVEGGIKSGQLQGGNDAFVHKFKAPGSYRFASCGHQTFSICTVDVAPTEANLIRLFDGGFSINCFHVTVGEKVTWFWNDCRRPQSIIQLYGSFNLRSGEIETLYNGNLSPPSISGSYEHTFETAGVFFFQTETLYTGSPTHLCIVDARSEEREYVACVNDDGIVPASITITEGDRIWWHWNGMNCKRKHNIVSRHIQLLKTGNSPYKFLSGSLQSSTGTFSHVFNYPGVYHYVSEGSELCIGVVIVVPRQAEKTINIDGDEEESGCVHVNEGSLVWLLWNETKLKDFAQIDSCMPTKSCGRYHYRPCPKLSSTTVRMVSFSSPLDERRFARLNDFGKTSQTFDDVGVFWHSTRPRTALGIHVDPTPQNRSIQLQAEGFEPARASVHVGDYVWWKWHFDGEVVSIVETDKSGVILGDALGGGPPVSVGAAICQLTVPGLHYFASSGSCCEIEVLRRSGFFTVNLKDESQLQREVVFVSPGDCIYWQWNQNQSYNVHEFHTGSADPVEVHSCDGIQDGVVKKCYFSKTLWQEGGYHFAFLPPDKQRWSHKVQSLTTVIVEQREEANVVFVKRTGFTPAALTVGKNDTVVWRWSGPDEFHNIYRILPPSAANAPMTAMDGPAGFSSGEMVSDGTFSHVFSTSGTFVVTSDGSSGSQCAVIVLKNADKTPMPFIANEQGNTVSVGCAAFLDCSSDDADISYTLDGSDPRESDNSQIYDSDCGIVFSDPGPIVIRACAMADDLLTSDVFTSRLIWVIIDGAEEEIHEIETQAESDSPPSRVEVATEVVNNFDTLACMTDDEKIARHAADDTVEGDEESDVAEEPESLPQDEEANNYENDRVAEEPRMISSVDERPSGSSSNPVLFEPGTEEESVSIRKEEEEAERAEDATSNGISGDDERINAEERAEEARGASIEQSELSRLWCDRCTAEIVKFAWDPAIWDAGYGGRLVLRIEGSRFAENVDSHSRCETSQSLPSEENASVHSWRIPDEQNTISTRGCCSGIDYKAWLCSDATLLISEVVSFTPLSPPERRPAQPPSIRILDLEEDRVTLAWSPPRLDNTVVSLLRYQVYVQGIPAGEPLDKCCLKTCVAQFDEGSTSVLQIAAVVQANKGKEHLLSDAVTVTKPVPIPSPELSPLPLHDLIESRGLEPTHSYGCIGLKWRVSTSISDAEYDVFLDGRKVDSVQPQLLTNKRHNDDSGNSDESRVYAHIVTDCQPRRTYDASVRAVVRPKKSLDEVQNVVMLPSEGAMSNAITVVCAAPPDSPPELRLSSLDHIGIAIEWNRPNEYGEAKLSGFFVDVNGRRQCRLSPEARRFKLDNCDVGRRYQFTVTSLTEHLVGKPLDEENDGGAEAAFVDSPADGLVKSEYHGCVSGSSLSVRFSGLLLPPDELRLAELRPNSVVVAWKKNRTTRDRDDASHYVNPDKFLVRWIKAKNSVEEDPIECKTVVKASAEECYAVTLSPLEVCAEYVVSVEAQARIYGSFRSASYTTAKARSKQLVFSSAEPPGPPRDLNVVAVSFDQIAVEWTLPEVRGIPIEKLIVTAQTDDESSQCRIEFPVDTTSAVLSGLKSSTAYVVTVATRAEATSVVSTRTLGLEPASTSEIESKTQTAFCVYWAPAATSGLCYVESYIVQWREAANDFRPIFPVKTILSDFRSEPGWNAAVCLANETRCTLSGMIAGLTYAIRVVTVVKSALRVGVPDVPSMFWHVGLTITERVPAAVDCPHLHVAAYTESNIDLFWPKPSTRVPVRVDSDGIKISPNAKVYNPSIKGTASAVSFYRVEVNGSVLAARLNANQNRYVVTGCTPGDVYRIQLIAMSARLEESRKGLKNRYDESVSELIELKLPSLGEKCVVSRLACHVASFSTTAPVTDGFQSFIAVEWRFLGSELYSPVTVRKFVLRWWSNRDASVQSAVVPANQTSYDIKDPEQRATYSLTVEVVPTVGDTTWVSPVVTCQIPGQPDPPDLWLHSATESSFTIEWSEPKTYGGAFIKGFQAYVNGKKTGHLLSPSHRKARLPYKQTRKYSVTVVAVSCDADIGDSRPSPPLYIDGAALCRPKGVAFASDENGTLQKQKLETSPFLEVHTVSVGRDFIDLDWKHFLATADVAAYTIQWSSTVSHRIHEVKVDGAVQCYSLKNCLPGTSHFVRVVAIGDEGTVMAKSKQLTVQTGAVPNPPKFLLRESADGMVILEWVKPDLIGPTVLSGYKLKADCDQEKKELLIHSSSTSLSYSCNQPCEVYTFQIKALAGKLGESSWSEKLTHTTEGVKVLGFRSVSSNAANVVKVMWEVPKTCGNIRLRSFKVFCLFGEESDSLNASSIVSDSRSIAHGPLRTTVFQDVFTGISTESICWLVLAVESSYSRVTYSSPIRARPTQPPNVPSIAVTVLGLDERKQVLRSVHELLGQRDSLSLKLHWQKSKLARWPSKRREEEVTKVSQSLAATEKELVGLVKFLHQRTGFASVLVSWSQALSEENAVVTGYQLFVDGEPWGRRLLPSATEVKIKLGIDKTEHSVQLVATTDHPIGNSEPSNCVAVSVADFKPLTWFCLSSVHCEGVRWPEKGSCAYQDTLTHELTRPPLGPGALHSHLGFLRPHSPSSPLKVVDVLSGQLKSLAPLFKSGVRPLPSLVLFWTRWCSPSLAAMEVFIKMSDQDSLNCRFVTCCLESGEGHVSQLRNLVLQTLAERRWKRNPAVVQQCCAPSSSLLADSVQETLGIIGVPTWLCIHPAGYVGWQGRCPVVSDPDSATSFFRNVIEVVLDKS